MSAFQAEMEKYRADHRTLGCRLTHMIGVPMIVCSLLILPFNRRVGLLLFAVGWLFQFAGHYIFEGNRPAFFSSRHLLLNLLSALVLVAQEWWRLVTTGKLEDSKAGNP